MIKLVSKVIFVLLTAFSLSCCTIDKATETEKTFEPSKTEVKGNEVRVLVDSDKEELIVYRGGKVDAIFYNLAFGTAGVKHKVKKGDDITPKGTYKIGWISKKSKFKIFIGLNYPSTEDAVRGLENKIISKSTFEKIIKAYSLSLIPPQDTALGGQLGIHGLGKASQDIHKNIDWTAGCIAMENWQIEKFVKMIEPGVLVEIR